MNKFNSVLFIAAFAAGALFVAGSAVQAQKEGRKGGACRADVERLCGGIEKGEGRIRQCMKEKKDQLSPECRARLDKGKQMRQACKEDHQKFCKGKRGKDGRKCMRENKDKLSASCKAAIGEMRGRKNQ